MNHYRNLALMYEMFMGGLIVSPLELLSLYDDKLYLVVKNKSKMELAQFIEGYTTDYNLNRQSIQLLENSKGIRYMISEGFHDALLVMLETNRMGLSIFINSGSTFCHPRFEADISQVVFQEAVFDNDKYNRLYNNLEKKLLYVRQNFELIDDKIITKLTFCPNSVLMEHPLSIESKDIIITPYSK